MRRAEWLAAGLLAVVAVAVVGHALALMAEARHPLPAADQWGLVVDIDRWDRGEWRLPDLWKQHNEHRWPVPRLLFIADLAAFQFRSVLPLPASVLTLFAHALLLVSLARRAVPTGPPWSAAAVAVVFLLLFSASQIANLELPLGFAFLFASFAASCACAAFARAVRAANPDGRWLAAALLAATLASFSNANGLVIWPVLALLALWLLVPARGWGMLGAVAAVVLGSYLWGYRRPPGLPEPLYALLQPLELVRFVCLFLGSPFRAAGESFAGLAGALALAGFAALAWRTRGSRSGSAAALLGIVLFAFGSAGMVALGRVGTERGMPLDSRYASVALVAWAVLGAWACRRAADVAPVWRLATALTLFGLVAVLLPQQWAAQREVEQRVLSLEQAALAVRVGVDDVDALARIHPRPKKVLRLLPVLRRRELSVFAEPGPPLGEPIAEQAPERRSDCRGVLAALEPAGLASATGARAAGWIAADAPSALADRIWLVDDAGVVVGEGRPWAGVPDRADRRPWRGYAAGAGPRRLRAFAVLPGEARCLLGAATQPAPE